MLDWLKSRRIQRQGDAKIAPEHEAGQVFDVGNGLRVHQYAFDIKLTHEVLSCWVYRSEGLRRWGHAELLFAVPRISVPTPPKDPLYHTQVVAGFAAKGQAVAVGGYTAFGPSHPGLFGRRDFRGVGYAFPSNLQGALPSPAAPAEYLAVIALTENEVLSAQRFGLARTLARLGQGIRFFPYPAWTDPRREEVIDQQFLQATFLRNFWGVLSIDGFAPVREQGVVRIWLPASGACKMASAIDTARQKKAAILFPTTAGLDKCMACLTWEPGSPDPTAITAAISADGTTSMQASGQSLLGCFLGFLPANTHGEGILMIEDGYCLTMGEKTGEEFLTSLQNHKRFYLEGQANLLHFEFIPTRDVPHLFIRHVSATRAFQGSRLEIN